LEDTGYVSQSEGPFFRSNGFWEVRKAMARNGISQVRGGLYGLARLLGDLSAARKGPDAFARRMARRAAGRAMGRLLSRLFGGRKR
jgi:hypothetical protein